jgi:predicted small lipoprotein YifL
MNTQVLRCITVIGVIASIAGCAAKRPVLYPNQKVQTVGHAVTEFDIDECMQLAADAGLKSNRTGKVAGSTAVGAASGAAVGAAVGAVTGRPGRGAAVGAAGGGTGGLIRGLFRSRDLDPVQQRFVEECLGERGYKVIGWR